MRNFLASLSFFLILHPSQAGMMGASVSPDGPGSVCKIELGNEVSCSAVLIDPTHVLTAGHCVENLKDSVAYPSVSCGFTTTPDGKKKPLESSGVKSALVHPGFSQAQNSATKNDIGIIVLKKPISDVPPMAVASPDELNTFFFQGMIRAGVECEAAGFGINSMTPDGKTVSGSLRHMSVSPTAMNENIIQMVNNFETGDPGFLQRYDDVIDRCKHNAQATAAFMGPIIQTFFDTEKVLAGQFSEGDSGGPLYCRKSATDPWSVVGVASMVQIPSSTSAGKRKWSLYDTWTRTNVDLSTFKKNLVAVLLRKNSSAPQVA
jgi:secreted trypsin-like serine protease